MASRFTVEDISPSPPRSEPVAPPREVQKGRFTVIEDSPEPTEVQRGRFTVIEDLPPPTPPSDSAPSSAVGEDDEKLLSTLINPQNPSEGTALLNALVRGDPIKNIYLSNEFCKLYNSRFLRVAIRPLGQGTFGGVWVILKRSKTGEYVDLEVPAVIKVIDNSLFTSPQLKRCKTRHSERRGVMIKCPLPVNEAVVGLILTKARIPYFLKTLGFFSCPKATGPIGNQRRDQKDYLQSVILLERINYTLDTFLPKEDIPLPYLLNQLDITYILFQTLYALYEAQERLKFTHFDLHSENIMILVRRSNSPEDNPTMPPEFTAQPILEYVIEGRTYYLPNLGYMVKIGDFSLSRISFLENNFGNAYKYLHNDIKRALPFAVDQKLFSSYFPLYDLCSLAHVFKDVGKVFNEIIGEEPIFAPFNDPTNPNPILKRFLDFMKMTSATTVDNEGYICKYYPYRREGRATTMRIIDEEEYRGNEKSLFTSVTAKTIFENQTFKEFENRDVAVNMYKNVFQPGMKDRNTIQSLYFKDLPGRADSEKFNVDMDY